MAVANCRLPPYPDRRGDAIFQNHGAVFVDVQSGIVDARNYLERLIDTLVDIAVIAGRVRDILAEGSVVNGQRIQVQVPDDWAVRRIESSGKTAARTARQGLASCNGNNGTESYCRIAEW